MIHIFNGKAAEISVYAYGQEFKIQPAAWSDLPVANVSYASENYAVPFHTEVTMIIREPDVIWKEQLNASGGLLLMFMLSFGAWIVVTVLNRAF